MIRLELCFATAEEVKAALEALAGIGAPQAVSDVVNVAPPQEAVPPDPDAPILQPDDDDEKLDEEQSSDEGNDEDLAERTAINAYPSALEIAADKGVDLTLVKGSGKDGKITKGDVLKYVEQRSLEQRAEKMAAVAQELEAGTEPTGGATKTLTVEDCREALSELAKAKDFKTCASVLQEFEATKISALTPEQYLPFCQRCDEVAKS